MGRSAKKASERKRERPTERLEEAKENVNFRNKKINKWELTLVHSRNDYSSIVSRSNCSFEMLVVVKGGKPSGEPRKN